MADAGEPGVGVAVIVHRESGLSIRVEGFGGGWPAGQHDTPAKIVQQIGTGLEIDIDTSENGPYIVASAWFADPGGEETYVRLDDFGNKMANLLYKSIGKERRSFRTVLKFTPDEPLTAERIHAAFGGPRK